MVMRFLALALATLAVLMASPAHSQSGVLARFDIDPDAYGVPSFVAPGVTSSLTAVGAAPSTYETFEGEFDATLRGVAPSASIAATVAGGIYYQFDLTKAGGLPPTVSMNFSAAAGGPSRPRGLVIRTSLDGYASDAYVHMFAAGTSLRDRTAHSFTVATGGASTVSFRVYSYLGAGSVNHINAIEFADATPAPVPTLSEWAMIIFATVLAGGAALYIRRRQFGTPTPLT